MNVGAQVIVHLPSSMTDHRRHMRPFKDKNLTERLQNAAQATQALLQKFLAQPGPDDPIVKERQAKRQAIAAAREARARESESAIARAEQERAELEAREEAERAAILERELQDHIAHEAEKKAIRDARYAARKKRKK